MRITIKRYSQWTSAVLMACACALAGAQPYPSKPIRFLLPFAPGGIGDITARIVAQKMSENIGQQVLVDNKPGAGMIISATAAMHANADGYTMLLAGNGTAVSASLFKSLPYDILKDFTQVSTLAGFDLVLIVNADSRFSSLADMLAYGKSNPGKLNLGTISPGSTQHLSAELFKSLTKLNAQTVPYKATGDLIVAMRGKSIDVGYEFLPAVLGQIKSGAVKAIAVASQSRFPALPNVPTAAEAGLPDYQVSSWNGASVVAKTPPQIVEQLNKIIVTALNSPDVKQKLQDLGAGAKGSTTKEAREIMVSEIARWRKVIEAAGIEKQ